MNKKIFYRVKEFYNEVQDLRENGVHRGINVGFHELDKFYTKKLGGTSYFYSAPYSGKSELAFELALNCAQKYGWIIAIYSPESGNKAEIVSILVHKITGRELYSKHHNTVDDELLKQALSFINDHFIFIDPDNPNLEDAFENSLLTVVDFLKAVRAAERYYDISIQETIIDPFNELTHDFSKDEGRQDLYIERMLGIIRRDAKMYNRHNTIVTHVKDQTPILTDGIRYYPPASARELAGGQAWYRKGFMMVSLWRPPFGLKDRDGRPFEENELHFIVQKVKPRYCGERGTVVLFFDKELGRYYEKAGNQRCYAFQYENEFKNSIKRNELLI